MQPSRLRYNASGVAAQAWPSPSRPVVVAAAAPLSDTVPLSARRGSSSARPMTMPASTLQAASAAAVARQLQQPQPRMATAPVAKVSPTQAHAPGGASGYPTIAANLRATVSTPSAPKAFVTPTRTTLSAMRSPASVAIPPRPKEESFNHRRSITPAEATSPRRSQANAAVTPRPKEDSLKHRCSITPPAETTARRSVLTVPTPHRARLMIDLPPRGAAESHQGCKTPGSGSSSRRGSIRGEGGEGSRTPHSDRSRESSPDSSPIVVKSEYHKQFLDATIPKRYFKALDKLADAGCYFPRQEYSTMESPVHAWKRNPSTTMENIWSDSDAEDVKQ